jgi:WhiB family transcriptional regulator, redox-sensing transcriptional regulator
MTRYRNQHTTRATATPPVSALPDRACADADPEIFFPIRENDAWEALAYCDICPHRQPCLEWALESEQQHGIWGGTTAEERRRMIRGAA